VPADLRNALAADPAAKATWSDITPVARRDWIAWITSGKKAETRGKRVAVASTSSRRASAAHAASIDRGCTARASALRKQRSNRSSAGVATRCLRARRATRIRTDAMSTRLNAASGSR
jgi:hypothetical protein